EIHSPARTPQRRRHRRHPVLADVQHSFDERRQLPQLQKWWSPHLSRRRLRYVPGPYYRAEHRLLEHHHRYSEPPRHQRDAQADVNPFDQDHSSLEHQTQL
ncbi:FIG00954920: hypothetical protein, partial [Pseudomonas fluorescens]